jgi:hypothetical protein
MALHECPTRTDTNSPRASSQPRRRFLPAWYSANDAPAVVGDPPRVRGRGQTAAAGGPGSSKRSFRSSPLPAAAWKERTSRSSTRTRCRPKVAGRRQRVRGLRVG